MECDGQAVLSSSGCSFFFLVRSVQRPGESCITNEIKVSRVLAVPSETVIRTCVTLVGRSVGRSVGRHRHISLSSLPFVRADNPHFHLTKDDDATNNQLKANCAGLKSL